MVDRGYVSRTFEVIRRIADGLAKCRARLRYCVMFCAGAFTTLALAPANFLPALYISMPIFVWCLADTKTSRSAFATGWWFGFGYFVFGLYWLGYVMLVQASQHGLDDPFCYFGVASISCHIFRCGGDPSSLGAGSFFTSPYLGDDARGHGMGAGHVLTGFPGICWARHGLVKIACCNLYL